MEMRARKTAQNKGSEKNMRGANARNEALAIAVAATLTSAIELLFESRLRLVFGQQRTTKNKARGLIIFLNKKPTG